MWMHWLPLVLFWSMCAPLYAAPPPPFSHEFISDIGVGDEIELEPEILNYLQRIVSKHANQPHENWQENVPRIALISNGDSRSRSDTNYKEYVNPRNFRDLNVQPLQGYNLAGLHAYHEAVNEVNTPRSPIALEQNITPNQICSHANKDVATVNPEQGTHICFEKVPQQQKQQCVNRAITNQLIINQATNATQIQVHQFGQNKNVLHNLLKFSKGRENNAIAARNPADLSQQHDNHFESEVKSADIDINSKPTKQKVAKLNKNMKDVKNMLRKILERVQVLKNTEMLASGEIPAQSNDEAVKNTTIVNLANTTIEIPSSLNTTDTQSTKTFTSSIPASVSDTLVSNNTAASTENETTSANITAAAQTQLSPSFASLTILTTSPPILRTASTRTAATETATSSAILTTIASKEVAAASTTVLGTSSTDSGASNTTRTTATPFQGTSTAEAASEDPLLNDGLDNSSEQTAKYLHCIIRSKKPRNRKRTPLNSRQISDESIVYKINRLNPARKRRPRPDSHFKRSAYVQTKPKGPATVYLRRVVKKPQNPFTSSVRFAKFKSSKLCHRSSEEVYGTLRKNPHSYGFDGAHQTEINTDLHQSGESEESAEALDYVRPNYRESHEYPQYFK